MREVASVRLSPAERSQLEERAADAGLSFGAYLRRLAEVREPKAEAYPAEWCLEDFEAFCSGLTLPDGEPFVLEGHLRLIIREVFEPGRVEVVVLLPKGNYKTTLFAALAVFHTLTTKNANCYIGAADSEQAKEMYRFATHFVESDPEIEARLLVRRSTKEIRSQIDQGFIRVLASDDSRTGGKKQGFNPTLALIDELHAHENDNLYVDMRSGLFKRHGLLVTITTAGSDEESVLGHLRGEFLRLDQAGGEVTRALVVDDEGEVRLDRRKGRLTICRAKSGRTVMLEWACRDSDDLDDLEVVKWANPAGGVTIDSLEDAKEAPGITPAQFARYRANVWSQADDAVIEEAAWDALNDGSRIPDEGMPGVWVIIDYARKSDATAVVQLWFRPEDERVVPEAHVWALEVRGAGKIQPAAHTLIKGQRTIRQSLVREHVRAIAENREVLGVIFDPHLFDPEELEDEGFTMSDFPQRPERTVPASKRLYEAINEGRIRHDGDPVLRSHVLAAGAKPAGEAWRFSKARSKKRIDALICLMMGIELALRAPVVGGFEW